MQILEATPERRGSLQARGPGAALAPAHTVRMLRALGTRVRVHLRTKVSPPHTPGPATWSRSSPRPRVAQAWASRLTHSSLCRRPTPPRHVSSPRPPADLPHLQRGTPRPGSRLRGQGPWSYGASSPPGRGANGKWEALVQSEPPSSPGHAPSLADPLGFKSTRSVSKRSSNQSRPAVQATPPRRQTL